MILRLRKTMIASILAVITLISSTSLVFATDGIEAEIQPASGCLPNPLNGKKIIVDAGHGGNYPGAQQWVTLPNGSPSLQSESQVTLAVAQKVKSYLLAECAIVYMTRTSDVDFGGSNADDDINKRVTYINNNIPASNALISIHFQPSTAPSGVGPYYYSGQTASQNLAQTMVNYINPVNAVLAPAVRTGNFAILRDVTKANAKTLLELDNIGHQLLYNSSHIDQIAADIVAGLSDYF